MEIFLNIVQAISDSRFWLGPVLVVCILGLIISEIKDVFKNILKDMKEPEIRDQESEARHLISAYQGEAKRSLDI